MMTPRIYGTPTAKAAAVIRSRDELVSAIRTNDDAAMMGLSLDVKAGGNGGTPFGFFDFSGGIQLNQFSGYASYLAACTKRVWAVARANDIIANIVISTDMKMQSRDKAARANRRKVPRVDPDLIRLLENPNPYDTISEMLYLWVCHMKLTGNAFWFKDEMNGYGQPKNIYWLNPKNIIIVPDTKTKIKHYIYRVNGTDVIFYPEEIIHFKRPHPDNSLWGLGDIEQGESLYDDFINRALYNTRLMANGAMPSSVLVKEDFEGDQTEWEKMKAKFQETHGGAKNAGKVAWMNGKWSLLQMGITAKEMQEMEKAKVNVEHIFLNAGVPLSVAGFGAANYATARQDRINMRSDTCLPLVNLFCDAINSPRGLVPSFHEDLMLGFALAGLIDVEQVTKEYEPLVKYGSMTPNDFNEVVGRPRVDNPLLDQYYIDSNRMPIEMAGLADVPPVSPAGAKPKPALPAAA